MHDVPKRAGGCTYKVQATIRDCIHRRSLALSMSSNHVVVLDVNGVLCRKVFDSTYTLKDQADAYTPSGLALFMRPGVDAMLKRLTDSGWRIIFWSSAMRQTVDAIRNALFPYVQPLSIMTHENSPDDERHPVVRAGKNWSILKDLRLLWRVPALRCGPSNTVIVDDSWSKIRLQADNAVVVPSFTVNVHDREAANIALHERKEREIVECLTRLLLSMQGVNDVRDVLKQHASSCQYIKLGSFCSGTQPVYRLVAAVGLPHETFVDTSATSSVEEEH